MGKPVRMDVKALGKGKSRPQPPFAGYYVHPAMWARLFGDVPARRGSTPSPRDKAGLVRVMPVADFEIGEDLLDPAHVMFLAQAAFWHEIAWLLGKSPRLSDKELSDSFAYFVGVFHMACVPALLGTRSEPAAPLTQAAVIKAVQKLGDEHWARLPRHRGRPGSDAVPDEAFAGVADWIDMMRDVRTDVVRPFEREFGKDVWTSRRAFDRLLSPGRYKTAMDRRARRRLESLGFDLAGFDSPESRRFHSKVFAMEPTQAALTIAMEVAKARYQYRGGFRAFRDQWSAYNRSMARRSRSQ